MEIKNIDVTNLKPDIRHLNELKGLLYDTEWEKTAPDDIELYYMYRILKEEDGLRYDITIIPPKMFGSEFVKTKGHIHAGFYGEIYAVLEGEGFYLYQKGDGEKIEDVCVVKAKKGDIIAVPAGYGHVTINPGNSDLKMANWVKKEDKGNFSPFEKLHGACYYYTKQGWIKNENYKNVPELRFEEPLKSVPENLDFLKNK
ncbi:MAG: glucose-6-phosphate isomerase family protein [Candidatus Staskawiczbacteria bacterium]|nr:glucose-6-phosphate isomerase family protein [Candidatus Staskawiczbacteria bacterium]